MEDKLHSHVLTLRQMFVTIYLTKRVAPDWMNMQVLHTYKACMYSSTFEAKNLSPRDGLIYPAHPHTRIFTFSLSYSLSKAKKEVAI